MNNNRRKFLKTTLSGAAVFTAGSIFPVFTAASYRNIIGANDRVRVNVMGVNSRGQALANNFAAQKNAVVASVSDVDTRATAKCIASVAKNQQSRPADVPDFRKALESKEIDAVVIAAPDHWHAPATLLASSAGKHVYVEKPCSHNPHEGELLVQAAQKYKNIIQMGNQRRSWSNVQAAMRELHNNVIGRAYFAKTWYTNNRQSIGKGKAAPVPSWLNYELWQGPAPREPYRDNLIHYNWHWFWHWGTGEALNNGVHMIDLARWGLNADYASRITSAGGRYRFQDDWETPDTQVITIEFPNRTSVSWEGRSCNGRTVEGAGVGIVFYGDNGSLMIDGNGYTIYDLENKVVKAVKDTTKVETRNLASPADELDAVHIQNFIRAVTRSEKQNSPISEGHKSTLLCQLGNIAQRSGNTLKIDPDNGHILNDKSAAQFWKREYEKGWQPVV